MKKVITPVGTSLLRNAEEKEIQIQDQVDMIEDLSTDKYDEFQDVIQKMKKKLRDFLQCQDESASAEISSLAKMKSLLKEEMDVYLLCSDTLLSILCAEVIKERIEKIGKVYFNIKQDVIKELQIKDQKKFTQGMVNLLNRLRAIGGEYYENVVINMTGGYKATLPYLTIFAAVHSIPMFYKFEDTDALIHIPSVPISYPEKLFDKYWDEFARLHPNEILKKSECNPDFLKEAKAFLEIADNVATLNPLGVTFWQRYRQKYFIFYCPDETWQEIEKQKNIQNILKTKFWDSKKRKNKTEPKNKHTVYDDGNNRNRICYFEEEEKIYIYKTFQNEEEQNKYINEVSLDKEKVKRDAKLRRMEVKHV